MDAQKNFRLISWNINSLTAKYEFLQKLLYDHDPFAVCLQETKLKPTSNINIKNFNLYRYDKISDHCC